MTIIKVDRRLDVHDIPEDSIIGNLFVNNELIGQTLENMKYKIPSGSYTIELYDSPRFKQKVPLLINDTLGVFKHRYIEMHQPAITQRIPRVVY
jgi:hypothetical protein